MDQSNKAEAIIREHVVYSAGAATIPIPVGDVLAITLLQLDMVAKLAEIYDQRFSSTLGKSIILALSGHTAARLGASIVKALPGVGSLLGGAAQVGLAGASTYAIGQLMKTHFAAGGALETFDPRKTREMYEKYVEKGKGVWAEIRAESDQPHSVAAVADTLEKLGRLRDAGELTEAEYERLKQRLLSRVD